MLQIKNHTPFQPQLAVFANPAGVESVYVAVKAVFNVVGHAVRLADEQPELVVGDQYDGDPTQTSIKAAGEVTLCKPSTDVLIHGHAYAPGGRARESRIAIQVGSIEQSIDVIGDRVWDRRRVGPPQDFDRIPLVYERCYGGVLRRQDRDKPWPSVPSNPVGVGLSEEPGSAMPNFENPNHRLRRPGTSGKTVGFGPISPSWQPRLGYCGTYDEAYLKSRAPYLPTDFDERFFQCAVPELIPETYAVGGESVRLAGVTPNQSWAFDLPRIDLETISLFRGEESPISINLDTLTLYPDQQQFSMIYRGLMVVDKHLTDLARVDIVSRQFGLRQSVHSVAPDKHRDPIGVHG
ncbi:DUF2169 family type VI secretion system accessory protein [Novipirellula artificiosorum]|uniref:DUF2169 domain-containing protein n=1 Tax=Novipirellula artificiosorum TaxID=2528016 RepID=A0A5C6DTF2_9BACT|nr:DUF2169 domain-containing protein [Novipirellula artificiosorum]TWU40593.1 hypothetical protein Poly41_14260 [Novipirellula artificiosorum]